MNCAKFKLYHYPATRSARVKWILHEVLGDDFEVEIVHLYDGVQYQADYLAKNPNHCVPTLEVEFADGKSLRMIESAAMIAFIADAFPGKRLAPHAIDEPLARADYLQMLHFAATWMDMMLWQIRSHEHLLPVDQRDPRVAERYRAKFTDEVEPQLLARLGQQAFICGEYFSAADCVITHNIMWAKSYGLCSGDIFKRYLVSVHKHRPWCLWIHCATNVICRLLHFSMTYVTEKWRHLHVSQSNARLGTGTIYLRSANVPHLSALLLTHITLSWNLRLKRSFQVSLAVEAVPRAVNARLALLWCSRNG